MLPRPPPLLYRLPDPPFPNLIVLIVIVLAILSRTLYKAKHPVTTVNSVSLRSFDFSLLRLKLNLTLDLSLSIHNPNRVRFKYRNSTALLNFNGQLIGQVPIPTDEINARDTNGMNLILTIFADSLLSDSQAYAGALAGSLPLNSQTRIAGRIAGNVTVFSFIKVNVVSDDVVQFRSLHLQSDDRKSAM